MDRSRRLTRQERRNWGRNSNSNTGSTAVAQDYTFRQGETVTDYINRNFSNPALRRTQLSLASSSQTPQTDTAITTSTLTPEQPITTPVIQQPTQSGGLASDVTSKAEAFANSVVNSTVDKSTVDDARKGFFEKMMGQKTKSQLQGDEYSATVDPAKKELDDIQNQIRERSLAYRRQEEELQKNTRGLFGGALQQETNRIRQEGAKELADLSIIEQAKLTNYSTAKDIADRAINAQLEQQSKELDAWKFWYTENKEQFTKEEDRRFTAMIGERERLLNKEEADKKLISDSVIDALGNGLPTNLAQQALKAKTFDEAIGLIGPYMRDQEKALRIQKLNAEIAELNPSSKLVTNPDAEKYAGLVRVVLGSTNFTKENKNSFIDAVNNGEDPFVVIKNQAKRILGTEGKDLTNLETAQNAMFELDNSLKQFYTAGGDSGIFSGNFEKTFNKLGAVNDPNLVKIAVQIASSLQKYRNAISGTAYSEQEGRDIAAIFPGITKGELLNNTITAARIQSMQFDIDGYYRSAIGSGYDFIKNLEYENMVNGTGQQQGGNSQNDPLGIF